MNQTSKHETIHPFRVSIQIGPFLMMITIKTNTNVSTKKWPNFAKWLKALHSHCYVPGDLRTHKLWMSPSLTLFWIFDSKKPAFCVDFYLFSRWPGECKCEVSGKGRSSHEICQVNILLGKHWMWKRTINQGSLVTSQGPCTAPKPTQALENELSWSFPDCLNWPFDVFKRLQRKVVSWWVCSLEQQYLHHISLQNLSYLHQIGIIWKNYTLIFLSLGLVIVTFKYTFHGFLLFLIATATGLPQLSPRNMARSPPRKVLLLELETQWVDSWPWGMVISHIYEWQNTFWWMQEN